MKEVIILPKCILAEQSGKGGGSGIVLMKIEVTTNPNKTSYLAGDNFNSAGMVVTASYGTRQTVLATAEVSGYSVSPSVLTDGTTSVTITYSEGGETCTTILPVTVTHRLSAITVTAKPNKLTYEYGDTLATAGMVVTASYSDSQTKTVTGYSCSPTIFSTIGNQVVTISYTENGVTQTATFNVTVNRKAVTKPTWKNNLTYNGNAQSVSSASYWNNYNTSYMTIGGTTSAANAGTYIATFTPGSNYRWADGTTTAINVNWTINRAAGSLSVNPTIVALNGNNYSSGVAVTITRAGDGAISYSPTNVNGLTMSLNGNVLTIKGNGFTAIASQTITISVAQGTNYTAPSNKTITISAQYWSWGADGGTVDAAWFNGLKNYLASNSGSSIRTSNGGSILGTTKSVTLSSAILGTTTHLIRVIGVDQDANNTVTFQTKNCLSQYTTFGNNAMWIGSTARSLCQDYYNAFPGKAAIKTVSKGTCPDYGNRNQDVTYNNETVFLLSEREFGLDSYSPLSTSNSTTSRAECTQGKNFAYSYYTSNAMRVMYLGDTSTDYGYPWERSRHYYDSTGVCIVGSSGGAGYNYYYGSSNGLAPAFVIGN